jgi:threonine/homoserine efflux transporter RhtA
VERPVGGVLTSKFRRKQRLRVFTFGVSVWSLELPFSCERIRLTRIPSANKIKDV